MNTTASTLRAPRRSWLRVALLGMTALLLVCRDPSAGTGVSSTTPADVCAGDCNGDTTVTVDEILTGINIALALIPPDRCVAVDVDWNGSVTVPCLRS